MNVTEREASHGGTGAECHFYFGLPSAMIHPTRPQLSRIAADKSPHWSYSPARSARAMYGHTATAETTDESLICVRKVPRRAGRSTLLSVEGRWQPREGTTTWGAASFERDASHAPQ